MTASPAIRHVMFITSAPYSHFIPSFSYASRALGRPRCVSALAGRDDLLRGVSPENRDDVARVLEQAERALASWEAQHTAFYSPPVIADAMMVLRKLADVTAVPWGGYPQAERCRISLGREEALGPAVDDPAAHLQSVAALQVSGNFLFDAATHRDFLGRSPLLVSCAQKAAFLAFIRLLRACPN